MKNYFLIILMAFTMLFATSCSSGNGNEELQNQEKNDENVVNTTESGDNTSSDENISKINVTFLTDYIDDDNLHLKVYAENTSESIFSGDIYVRFYTEDGEKKLGTDTIFVEDLMPGQRTWANVVIDNYDGIPEMKHKISNASFKPINEITAEVNQEATTKAKESFKFNFSTVSWYNDIADILIYTDGSCVVTLNDTHKNDGKFYATVIWNCCTDCEIKSVKVVDSTGKILAVYSK